MKVLLAALALLSPVTAAAQVPQPVDELRALVSAGSDSALVERVRRRPNEAREGLRQLLAAGVGEDSAGVDALSAAQRVAGAFVVAWRDSFLLRQAMRFQSLSPADRQATVSTDSILRSGKDRQRKAGVDAAMGPWRESLRRYEALNDSAGIADALTALGRGFYEAQDYDSAEVYLTRSQEQAELIGDYYSWGRAVGNMGLVNWKRGDLQRASELFVRAKSMHERIGDSLGLLKSQTNLGVVALSRRDLVGARRAFEAALAMARSAREVEGVAIILHNLGGVAQRQGNYAESAERLREALSIRRKLGNRVYEAQSLVNLGKLAMRRGDNPTAITTLSEAAEIMRRLGPGPDINEIDIRLELAQSRAAMGDLQGARSELSRAEALARRRPQTEASFAALARAQGNLAFKFNRLAEAERHYARAQRLGRGEGGEEERWLAQMGMSAVLYRRGSYERAQAGWEQVLLGGWVDPHNAANIRVMMGDAAWKRGDTATARRAYVQSIEALRELGDPVNEAETLDRLGDLEARGGRLLVAESLYQQGLTRLGVRLAPAVAWQLHAGLASSLRRRGALPDAARELLAGIGQIERVSQTIQLEEHRSAYQADKWDVYIDLAQVQFERGRTEAAFDASERLRGRQMLDLLARGRIAERGPLRELAMREQDLRRRIGELSDEVEVSGRRDPVSPQTLRDPAPEGKESGAAAEELARLQKDYSELLLEIRSAHPSYAALVRGETAPARAVMTALGPEEALLEYLVGDSTTLVFVVTADTLAALDLKVSHDALAAQVDFARSTLASPKEEGARRAWQPPLRRLYRQLVGPVEASGLLAGKQRLLIAPHAELHYLPFSALVQPGPPEQPLIERYLLEYVPSASVWLRLRDRPRPALSGGVLALAPRARALPGSRAEVTAIRRIYGERAQTLVGTPATERAFRDVASQQEIVHLATYGVLNKHNPLFSYVEMGAGGGDDGRLEVHEVFGLSLNARLLVLSACQTGLAAGALADVPPGDDWVGLVQGFLYAGASNVLATLWPVADVATARLMERFYGELATGRSEAEALALAQRAAARNPAMAHPFFWAGFTLVRGQ